MFVYRLVVLEGMTGSGSCKNINISISNINHCQAHLTFITKNLQPQSSNKGKSIVIKHLGESELNELEKTFSLIQGQFWYNHIIEGPFVREMP